MSFVFHRYRLIVVLGVAGSLLVATTSRGQAPASQQELAAAISLYQAGQPAEALAAIEKFLTDNKFSALLPEAIYYEGWCYWSLRRYREARDSFTRLRQQYPTVPLATEAALRVAECNRALDQLADALTQYRQFQSANPQHKLLSQAILGEVDVLRRQQDWTASQAVLQKLLAQVDRQSPVGLEALFLLGQVLADQKDHAAALAIFQQIADQSLPSGNLRPAALFRVADSYRLLSRLDEADEAYRQFLRLYPADPLTEQAHFGLIQTLADRRQLAEVETEQQAFARQHPGSKLLSAAEFLLAESLLGRQDFARAITSYRQFIATGNDAELLETAQLRIAESYLGLQQFAPARATLQDFLRQHPQSKLIPEVLFRLGRTYYALSQKAGPTDSARTNLTQAAEVFAQLRAQHPKSVLLPEATFQLGYVFSLLGTFDPADCDQAITIFQEFINRWPRHAAADGQPLAPEALFQIARNQARRGHLDQAVAAYQQIIDQYPAAPLAPFAAFEIANVGAGVKPRPELIKALRRYVAQFPDHTKVGDALYSIGRTLEQEQQIDEALKVYQDLASRAIARTNRLPEEFRNAAIAGQVRTATLLADRDQLNAAVAGCEEFLNKFSQDPLAARAMINQIATLYRQAKQLPVAYLRLDQIAARFAPVAAIRHATATAGLELALSQHDYARATPAADKLLSDPDRDQLPAASLNAIGNALLQTNRYREALAIYQELHTKFGAEPRDAALALLGTGQAQFGLQQLDEAGQTFRNPLIAARPEAELGLARVLLAQAAGRPVQDPVRTNAVALLTRVLAGNNNALAGEAGFYLGQFYFAQRSDPAQGRANCQAALVYFLRVSLLTGGPLGEEAAFRSAQCQESLGNLAAARRAYAAYLRRFPTGAFATAAQHKLTTLPTPNP